MFGKRAARMIWSAGKIVIVIFVIATILVVLIALFVELENDQHSGNVMLPDIGETVQTRYCSTRVFKDMEQAISECEQLIKRKHPSVRLVFIKAQRWRAHAEDARHELVEA